MFEQTKVQENEILAARKARIDQLERASGLAQSVLKLRNQPGFQEFVKVIEDLRTAAFDSMETARTSEDMWECKGLLKAYKNILKVMRDAENAIQTLEAQRKAAQDELDKMVGPNGRPVPSQALWS